MKDQKYSYDLKEAFEDLDNLWEEAEAKSAAFDKDGKKINNIPANSNYVIRIVGSSSGNIVKENIPDNDALNSIKQTILDCDAETLPLLSVDWFWNGVNNNNRIIEIYKGKIESCNWPYAEEEINDALARAGKDHRYYGSKFGMNPNDPTKSRVALAEADEEKPAENKELTYDEFVKKLDSADWKSEKFAKYIKDLCFKGDGAENELGKKVTLSSENATVACNKLKPTQNIILLDKSIGLIKDDKNAEWLKKILTSPTACFGKAGEDNPNGYTITYGDAIIDGHHRWSKIYALNGPEALCGIINFKVSEGFSIDDMLRATQLAIRAVDPNVQIVGKNEAVANMLTCSEADVKAITDNISEKCLAVFKEWKPELDSKEKVHAYIWKNIQAMQANNKPKAMHNRDVMPQTDTPQGGKGGAVELLKKGAIDTTLQENKFVLKEDDEVDLDKLVSEKDEPDVSEEAEDENIEEENVSVKEFIDSLKEYDKDLIFEIAPIQVGDQVFGVDSISFDSSEDGKVKLVINAFEDKMPEDEVEEADEVEEDEVENEDDEEIK